MFLRVSQHLQKRASTSLRYTLALPRLELLTAYPVRYFPRGIYKEQQLDKQKRIEEGQNKRLKPLDPERVARMKEAQSMGERS